MTIPVPAYLLPQWLPELNDGDRLENYSAGSRKIGVWSCSIHNEHTWSTSIRNRSAGQGCPFCSGVRIFIGFNDLPTTHPVIAAEWHPTKNGEVVPEQVSAGSNKKVWWLCPIGHDYEATVSNRSKQGQGCPYCAGRRVWVGFNDLLATHPTTAAQWHPTKNGALLPTQVSAGSNKKVWWECDTNPFHEWEDTVQKRALAGRGCPICSGHKVVAEINSLATMVPLVAAEWHPTKNGEVTAAQVSHKSGFMAAWSCKQYQHVWEARVVDRVDLGHDCPICSNQKVLINFNDLPTTHPILAKQWHPTKNGDFYPEQVSAGSGKTAWWLCDKGHDWPAQVRQRAIALQGCPTCAANTYVSRAENELQCFLKSFGFTVNQSDRSVLKNITNKEIDLYLPEQKFGIEFNGLYWHSDKFGKGKHYHQTKYLAAKEAGIQLVQIWEDDWRDRQSVILCALAHKLGVTDELAELYPELKAETSRVFARKTQVTELAGSETKEFLEFNHIQGFTSGSYYLSLQDEQEQTRAVLVLKKEAGTSGKTLNIVRYATSGTVIGGFTKLLKHAAKTYQPDDFITFADHCISDGGLYEKNGFIADKELAPDYMYVVKGERKHKFEYRLKRFRDDPELLWDENMSKRELAQLNGIPRIWDAGKTRYRYIVS